MSQPILTIRDKKYAHLLANYLVNQGHPVQVIPLSDNEYQISLENDADSEQVKLICEAFIREPNHPRYQQAAWQSGKQITMPRRSGGTLNTVKNNARHAPFTALIFVVCTLTYGLSLLGLFPTIYKGLMMQPLGMLSTSHEWWRLIGPVFLHFSALHFVFNLLWWATLGAQIERTLGVSMLLLVFVVSAIASNVGQLLVSGPNFGGMSGVVYALLGFIWWLGWLKPSWGLTLPRSIIGFMLVWLVIGYADILWVNMANTAHTVGLVSGCLLAALLALGSNRRKAG
ncbi:rhomboid family intramembrane serine protease GlpG [Salinimonas chungwhensis]|uniref:rhomboid family intramembrane serine protease GlpG n=1 Tax=Salinimonas chungwhensis TaxID=265425 RepID=UPI00036C5012|nr:rhomboid family intramembrane serine protease GlpG [Salinimonas chungwhensis]